MRIVWQDKTEAGIENEHGQRFVAYKQTTHDADGRKQSRWIVEYVCMQNMSDIRLMKARTLKQLIKKVSDEKAACPLSVRI